MAAIETTLLSLASSDLDADDSTSKRKDILEEAKEVVKDCAVRRELADCVSRAVEECSSFDTYERVLTVLITALFRETTCGDVRDLAIIGALADRVCLLIVSSSEHHAQLVTAAEAQLIRIRSDTISDAFANVSEENKKAGDILAVSTSRKKRRSRAEGAEASQQDGGDGTMASSASRNGDQKISEGLVAALDERILERTISAGLISQEDRVEVATHRAIVPNKGPDSPRTVGDFSEHNRGSRMTASVSSDEEVESDTGSAPSTSDTEESPGGDEEPTPTSDVSEDGGTTTEAGAGGSSVGAEESPGGAEEATPGSDVSEDGGTTTEIGAGGSHVNAEEFPGGDEEATPASDVSEDGGGAGGSSVSAGGQLSQLEADVVSKSRLRRSSTRSSSATSQLHNLESDVLAKTVSTGTRPRSARTDLNALECDVLAKTQSGSPDEKHRGLPPAQTPGVTFEREDGQVGVHGEGGWESHAEHTLPPEEEGMDKDASRTPTEDGAGAMLTADHGVVNEPHMQLRHENDVDPETPIAVLVTLPPSSGHATLVDLPGAIQCAPDSKPPLIQSKRVQIWGFLAFLLVVLIVTVVTKLVTTSDSGGSSPDSPSAAEASILKQLQIVVGEDKLLNDTSAEARAADWLINEDPLQLASDAPNLIQRYVLAVFYISTTEETPWLSCNRPEEGQSSECLFRLLTEVFPFIIYEQKEWYRWLSGEHECDWAGVFCDEFGVARALELWGQEISGQLSPYFKELTYMQSIALGWNNLHGTLPKEWAEMQHLLNIELHYNWLEGEVPEEWWKNSRWAMQRINIAANQFSGTVPTEIGELNGLKGFFSFENHMTGTFPTELGNIEFLAFTRLGRNFLYGTIPSELGKLVKMQEIWLHRNEATGTIPSELALMTDVEDLRLHFNPLNGTIPFEFYSLAALTRLDLYNCHLEGTIPTEVGGLSEIQKFRIRANNFRSTLPTELGLLYQLEELWTAGNDFTGTMPAEVCALTTSAQNVGLHENIADCLATTTDEGFGPPQIVCPSGCCSSCCDGATGVCN